jgi:lysophospholipid acyltransferase (LPLAT)-like uncharacterized protein
MSAWRAFLAGPLTRAAIRAGHLVVLALGGTWRVRHVGGEHVDAARGERGAVLYVFSHGVLLPLSFTHRRRDIQVLISESRDGEIIARITGKLGFGSVRGSTSRGGGRAIVRMAALGRQGRDLGITPDGPRGPRGSVGPGTVLVAARAGTPIVPVGVASRPAWRAKSWDRFLVPPPLARVWVVYGSSIAAGAGSRDETAARVAEGIDAVEREALRYAEGAATPERCARVPA